MTAFAKTYLDRKEYLPAALLMSSYIFGALMLGSKTISGFAYLTMPHLVFTSVLIAITHRPKPLSFWWVWAVLCFLIGYAVEYVGVHQKWLFGEYVYGDVLGPKLDGIPVLIGVNWILVVYATCTTLNMILPDLNRILKIVLAAILMVALDYLIEPVAISLDFWIWKYGDPPLQNFIGWLAVGIIQAGIFYYLIPFSVNRLAPLLLLLQVLFFGYLNIFL